MLSRNPANNDLTLQEKRDRTLDPGMLAFRNGKVLDLRAQEPLVRPIMPEDYVTTEGAIDRDLPDNAEALLKDDVAFGELNEFCET